VAEEDIDHLPVASGLPVGGGDRPQEHEDLPPALYSASGAPVNLRTDRHSFLVFGANGRGRGSQPPAPSPARRERARN
jgi:hypothetical protein